MLHTLNETNKPKNYGENKFKSKVRGLTMEKKYKLTEESINFFGITLYRIEALKDFGYIKKGDKGGYVESEANLSQEDNCWISDDAKICGNALVKNNFDYIVFKNWWSSGRYFTWTRSNNMWRVGCFYGTGEQLLEKAYHDNEISGREYKRVVDYVESILKDNR